MNARLLDYLEKHGIQYKEYRHKAVFTVAESSSIKEKIPGKHTKCLFLKDENSNYYLVALPAEKRLNTKELRNHLKIKKLNFASPEELKKQLNLMPGSVSIFGLIYTDSVHLILDKSLYNAEKVSFHPNINTSTLVLTHENLEKFLNILKIKKEIIEL